MSRIALAAPLIRLATVDDRYTQDLFEAVDTDGSSKEALVFGPIEEDDLAHLTLAEWQWYANWRQGLGGGLDETLLDHLTDCASTRFARFEVRALVLRDRRTNELAADPDNADPANRPDGPDAVGWRWLTEQAQAQRVAPVADMAVREHLGDSEALTQPPLDDPVVRAYWERRQRAENDEALELMIDALQCATEASWFLLRQLTSRNDEAGMLVQQQLVVFAERRGLNPQWYQLDQPLRQE
jgi:hypothetical protein